MDLGEEIRGLISLIGNPPEVLLVPDRRGIGVNAILSSPPGLIEYDLKACSFDRFVKQAEAAGSRVRVCRMASLELDLDIPDDLEALRDILSKSLLIQEKE
jgi:2-phospho-L-lactate guanylyltransferase (CobY/MobA/RfbA family)